MIETKHIIAELSVQEKICLYNALYEDLASKGIDGDTELAHVNKAEMEALRAMGGSGTVNPNTNLIQFGGGSPPPPPPTSQTVSQTSEFPEELKPYITDVLGKAQAIQEKREREGYRPYEGPQIAEFTPEQQEAFTGISGLVGEGGKYFDPATRLAASSAIAPRAGEVQQYMSPYMQNVVDIQQREAQRQADVAAQQLGAQAVGAGGFGGSRQAILEAEQQRNLQTQLGDIQARGLTSAYEDAQARMAAQRGRELAASGQFAQLGQIAPQQALKELTALEAVGAQQQALSQRGLDIAKSQFQQEQLFPEQTLQQYQSVIRGFPLAPSTYQTSQKTTPAPSYLQQAAGLGGLGLGVASAFGGFKAKGGLVSRMGGGQVDQNSGLGSIVVKRQSGKMVGLSTQELEQIITNYGLPSSQRAEAYRILMEKRKGAPNSSSATVAPKTPTNPPVKQAIKPAPIPNAALGVGKNIPSSESNISSLGSLQTSLFSDLLNKPKGKEYEKKFSKYSEAKRKYIEESKSDRSTNIALAFSEGLLNYAAADPSLAESQKLATAFSNLPKNIKEIDKDQRALALEAAGLDVEEAKFMAEQETKNLETKASIYKILNKDALDAKEKSTILNNEAKVIELIMGSADPDFIYKMMTHKYASDAVKAAAKTKYDKTKQKNLNDPNTLTIRTR
ncbi:MAG: hypothetical protein S4CHLAM20_11690 [Chlamydiia bacterium]|nr:hypothetical protein [Chlamydiia bacterium]